MDVTPDDEKDQASGDVDMEDTEEKKDDNESSVVSASVTSSNADQTASLAKDGEKFGDDSENREDE